MGNGSSAVFPAHVLGKTYEERQENEFRRRAESFFRFTYRRNMPALLPSTITSDSGWGCMLRSAQMLMGHALQRHHLGSEWRLPPDLKPSRVKKSRLQALSENEVYCNIATWFADYPGWPHIYSLHHLVHCGGDARYGKSAGQWVGPSTAAYLLRDLARIHCALYGGSLEVLVTQGDTVYKAEAEAVCTRTGASRAEYIAQLRTQSAQNSTTSRKSNRNNNSKSGDCDDEGYQAAEDAATSARASAGAGTMIHPLLIAPAPPLQHSTPTTSSAADDEVEDGWVGNSRISETYDRCSEVCNAAQIRNTSNDGPLAGNVNNKSNSVTQAPPKSVNNNGGSGGGGGGGGKCGGSSGDVTTTAEFFDPLLRPPPKVVPPWNTALLLLVPLMLGIHSVNKEYIEEIKEVLRHRHCVGILGGRPNHAIYFTGYRGDCLLGLDPHTVFPNPPRPPAPPISGVGAGVYPPPDIPLGCLSASASTTSAGASCNAGAKNRTSSTDRGGTGDSAAAGADCSNNKRTRSAGYSWESVDPTNHYTSKTTTGLSHNKQQLGLNTTYSSHDSNSCSSSTSTSTSTSESYFSSAFSFGANMSDSDSATATAAAFPTAEYLSQVHVPEFVTLDFSRLDPSMAVGFYFPDRAEFERFCEENRVLTARKVKEGKTPLFTVQNAAPAYMYSDAQEYGGSSGKNFGGGGGGGSGGGDGGGESVGKCGSFDPSDVDDHFEGGAVGAGAGSGRARRVPRVVSAEDSSDDDYVLV